MAREFEERNQKAKASVASIVGITIASMMPVALNRMSRWADAMGPLGSRTPSEQPPSMAMQIKGAPRTVNRIKFLPCSLGCNSGHAEGSCQGFVRGTATVGAAGAETTDDHRFEASTLKTLAGPP